MTAENLPTAQLMEPDVKVVPMSPGAIGGSVLAEVEKSRAVQEVQAALIIAKRFPRDEITAETKILTACKRVSLAEVALYAFPRAGETIEGPTIRLAETLARYWGNIQYGFVVLEQVGQRAIVEAFAWDQETNTRATRTFNVDLKIKLKNNTIKELTDPRDQYEMIANNGQRRVRSCILAMIPGEVVARAVRQVRATLVAGEKGEPLLDRVKRMVVVFDGIGVSREKLEKKLNHKIEEANGEELAALHTHYMAIKDGFAKREEIFDFGPAPETGKGAELNEKLKGEPK